MSSRRSYQTHTRLDALSYATRIWEALDTPLSLSCWILAKHGEFRQLVEKSVDATHYCTALSFYLDYQAVKLLSRYPYLDTGIDTDLVAKKKFIAAERQCFDTNARLRAHDSKGFTPCVDRVISGAARKIAVILGDVPKYEMLDFAFGPGAAYGVRKETSVFNKVSATLECTHAMADKLAEFLQEFPGWIPEGVHSVSLVPGSQLSIVPKNAKTGRPICIEPLLNGLYQKGVGTWIRHRLSRFGIDLNDQSVNQKLASTAHSSGLATVDFASASDTIAYRTVMDLLPIDWFEFLDVARCPRFEVDGNWYNFHKFSSMGNAYTFELETLIFYAVASATCDELGVSYSTGENLSVYGDDVIIPQSAFGLFSETCEILGFTINEEKSFSKGVFFESCGQDFFLGHLVRPYLISKKLNKLMPAFYAANTLKRIQKRIFELQSTDKKVDVVSRVHDFTRVHDWVVGCIPPRNRVWGPEGYGDGHLVTGNPKGFQRHSIFDGWWFRSYVQRPVKRKLDEWPMAYALYFTRHQGCPRLFEGNDEFPEPLDNGSGYTVRGSVAGPSLVKMLCHFEWQGIFD